MTCFPCECFLFLHPKREDSVRFLVTIPYQGFLKGSFIPSYCEGHRRPSSSSSIWNLVPLELAQSLTPLIKLWVLGISPICLGSGTSPKCCVCNGLPYHWAGNGSGPRAVWRLRGDLVLWSHACSELRLCGRPPRKKETSEVGLSEGRQLWYSPLLPVFRAGKERPSSQLEQEDTK